MKRHHFLNPKKLIHYKGFKPNIEVLKFLFLLHLQWNLLNSQYKKVFLFLLLKPMNNDKEDIQGIMVHGFKSIDVFPNLLNRK